MVDNLIEDLLAFAQIPGPTFAEKERIAWLETRLAGSPGVLRRDEAGNLIWAWGDGQPRVVLAAHVDTVFAEDTPLEVKREGADLVGPGVGDNAAAVAVAVHVTRRLLTSNELAPGAVAFTVGEEGLGSLRGARAVCELLHPDAFVALEGHGLDEVFVDALGSVRARLSVRGPGGHSWRDRGTPSAVHALLRLGAALAEWGSPEAPVNVGLVAGGRSVNSIADTAELVVEQRALEESVLDAFTAALEGVDVPSGLSLDVEMLDRRPSGRLDRDANLLATVRQVRAELALPDVLEAGSTDANAALAYGIPAVALGVARGSGMHRLDERIDGTSLALGARQVEGLLLRLLGERASTTPESGPC